MSASDLHPLARDYLTRLRRAGRELPAARLGELSAEVEGYLAESIAPEASDDEALEVLERLGAPGEIVEAEQAGSGVTNRRTWRERAALVLLPLGGFAFGVGWLVGLVLLWTSRLWTTRDKLIGTLIVPGGIATALLIVVLTGTVRRCSEPTNAVPSSGTLVAGATMHCTPSGGPGAVTTAFHIALVAFAVLGPVITAVYLARRAHAGSSLVSARF